MTPVDGRSLVLDGATGRITLAVFVDGALRGEAVADRTAPGHTEGPAEQMARWTAELLARASLPPSTALARIIVGGGPGSFTGLRAAAAFAKGLAHASGATLMAVPSLALLAGEALAAGLVPADAREVVAALDALRGESYVQRVALEGGRVRAVGLLERRPTATLPPDAVGPDRPGAVSPHARALAVAWDVAVPVPLDRWEPAYGRLAEAAEQRARAAAGVTP